MSPPSLPGSKRWRRVIPVAFLMYTIAFMDRINVGVALPAMSKSLHFSTTIGGLVFGIFFVGYLVLQIPGGHLAEAWSAKKVILTLLIAWSFFAMLTGAVQNVTELLAVRFLLGVAEGGVWPATLIFLSHWFAREERARANSLWMLCLPVAVVVVSPLSGLILASTHDNWHLLFLIEGLPPLVWAAVWAVSVQDLPRQARWISTEELAYVEAAVSAERATRDRPQLSSYRQALRSPVIWQLAFAYFFIVIPSYGVSSFLPTLLKKSGFSIGIVGVLTALPFVVAIFGLLVSGVLSDKSMARKKHVIIPTAVLAIGVVASALTEHVIVLSLLLLIGAGYGLYAMLSPFWAMVNQILPPETAGGGIGLVNAVGNLGGFAGPYAVGALDGLTGSFMSGFAFLGVAAVAAIVLVATVRLKEGAQAVVAGPVVGGPLTGGPGLEP
ncbi:MAG: MFS transporter [Acidimicrobiales bacterium]